MKQGSNELLNLINSTLVKLERSGEAEKIFNKWFETNQEYLDNICVDLMKTFDGNNNE